MVSELTMTEAEYEIRFGNDLNASKWLAAGRPIVWVISEIKEIAGVEFEVHVDYGYGHLKLLRNGIEVCRGGGDTVICSETKVPEKVVVLDKNYFGVDQYMFIPLE